MFYIFDSDTKEFLRETEGQPSPLEQGTFFTPASSTTLEPPVVAQYEVAIWDAGLEAWSITLDNRSRDYWNKASKEKLTFSLGDAVTAAMTSIEPNLHPAYKWDEALGAWAIPVTDAKTTKLEELYTYADSLVEAKEATFFTKGKSRFRNKERLARAQECRNTKARGSGPPLSQEEQDADARYESLMMWSDSVYAAAETAEDTITTLATTAEVEAYIVVSTPVWPVWAPPA